MSLFIKNLEWMIKKIATFFVFILEQILSLSLVFCGENIFGNVLCKVLCKFHEIKLKEDGCWVCRRWMFQCFSLTEKCCPPPQILPQFARKTIKKWELFWIWFWSILSLIASYLLWQSSKAAIAKRHYNIIIKKNENLIDAIIIRWSISRRQNWKLLNQLNWKVKELEKDYPVEIASL